MKNAIARYRKLFGWSVEQLAEKLGVTAIDVKRWERNWDNPDPIMVKELAVLFTVRSADVLAVETDIEALHESPYSAFEREVPYGTLAFEFAFGKREYPIPRRCYESILHQLENAAPLTGKPPIDWLQAWTLDNRDLFVNLGSVLNIHMVCDDAEAMPIYHHSEVYRTLSELDDNGELPSVGPLLRAACDAALMKDPQATRQATHIEFVTSRGKSSWVDVWGEGEMDDFFSLELEGPDLPRNKVLQITSTWNGSTTFYNLSNYALIELPRDLYHRQTAPH